MTDDRVDEVLRKITARGLTSLSKEERGILEAASAIYRRRREPDSQTSEEPTESRGDIAVESFDPSEQVTREEAARTHAWALSRGLAIEAFGLWREAGYVFTNRQPFRSEVDKFIELVNAYECNKCGRTSPKFFRSGKPDGPICVDCNGS